MTIVLYPDLRSTAKKNPCFKDCSSSPISIACHDVFNGITSGGKYGNNATNKQHGQYYSKVQTSLSKTRAQLKLFGEGNDQNNTAIMEWQDRLANHTKYSPTGPSKPALNTKGYSSTARTLANPIARSVLEYPFVLPPPWPAPAPAFVLEYPPEH